MDPTQHSRRPLKPETEIPASQAEKPMQDPPPDTHASQAGKIIHSSRRDNEDSPFPVEHDVHWALLGPHGLRAGWSAALFVSLYYLLTPVLDTIAVTIDPALEDPVFSPFRVLITEFIPFLTLVLLSLFMARIEHRRLVDYNLADTQPVQHFFVGLASGFAALSALVAALVLGGWIHFGPASLTGAQALKFGSVWAGAFLLVGLFEEGTFRCYLQFTLARGINFWWALAAVSGLCLLVQFSSDPKGGEGVYVVALLGLVPCGLLHRARSANSSFWQAAWTTSTAFGYYHTNNSGETWIGILAAALIGFVFCVSVRVTGSAWWAIGCHSAWDWAETFFYGTADSGFPARRHLFTSIASGNLLWSGGADGPEGSLLVVPIILLLLALLIVLYGRRRKPVPALA
jgi:membrane protease YdiL (CAAX protease family)